MKLGEGGGDWIEEIKEVVNSSTLYNGIWSTPLEGPSMLSAVHAYWKLYASIEGDMYIMSTVCIGNGKRIYECIIHFIPNETMNSAGYWCLY